jgi:DNA repair protein RAD7
VIDLCALFYLGDSSTSPESSRQTARLGRQSPLCRRQDVSVRLPLCARRENETDQSSRSNRRTRRDPNAGNQIRGPHSALTNFLAAHNISALQIQQDYQQRLAEAERERLEREAAENGEADKENDKDECNNSDDSVETKKRKRKEEKALMKIKQSKEFKRRKAEASSDELDDEALARQMMAKTKPLPGQLDNCEICQKRFTVTPYSRTGPKGGLLCAKCSKEMKDDEKKNAAAQKKRAAAPRGRKRQVESDRLMGDVKPGAKSLVEMCVRKVADVVNDIDDFGDLPPNLLHRLSEILSKNRAVTSRVLNLFLRPDVKSIDVYDCAKLETEDFQRIFGTMPHLEKVNLQWCGQFKDGPFLYMADKCTKLRELDLDANNLVSDGAWMEFFDKRGAQLESLKLAHLNDSMRDPTVERLVQRCGNLKTLELRTCTLMTEESIYRLATLTSLEHLTIAVAQEASAESLVHLITSLGPKLITLGLEQYQEVDDTVLEAIKENCPRLSKLRLTGSSLCHDRVFASLFDNNCPFPPLTYADLHTNRDLDAMNPGGNEEDPVGFCSGGLIALLNHSGSHLEFLNLKSNRHISLTSLLECFDGVKQYPELTEINMSFVSHLDDVVAAGIFKSCPKLAKFQMFGCFNARSTIVPKGVAVLGLLDPSRGLW